MSNLVIPDGGNIGSASDTDAISIASDGNISLGAGIVSGNFGTITQRNSSNSPTFTRSSGVAIDSTILGHLYGTTEVQPNGTTNATHVWLAWDYGAGVTRKITKLQFKTTRGQTYTQGVFLEGSNVASPNTSAGHSDWTQLKSFANPVDDSVRSYSSPVTATTLKYRHYRIRFPFSTANYPLLHSFVLEDTDSTFDARTALNATGSAPIYACRAWVNFNGNGTVAIRSSGNVSSITDNGTGNFTVNFTTAMPDANYATVCSSANSGSTWPRIIGAGTHSNSTYSTSQVGLYIISPSDQTSQDQDRVQVAVFR